MALLYDPDDWIACIEEELRRRRRIFPRWVELGHMSADDSARLIGVMESLLNHLLDTHRPREGLRPLENVPPPPAAPPMRQVREGVIPQRTQGPRDL